MATFSRSAPMSTLGVAGGGPALLGCRHRRALSRRRSSRSRSTISSGRRCGGAGPARCSPSWWRSASRSCCATPCSSSPAARSGRSGSTRSARSISARGTSAAAVRRHAGRAGRHPARPDWRCASPALGKQMRALSDNIALAEVSGIDTRRRVRITWAVAGALAALAGHPLRRCDRLDQPELRHHHPAEPVRRRGAWRHRQRLWRARRRHRHRRWRRNGRRSSSTRAGSRQSASPS